jgi:cytidyltransferase-like protein
MTRIIVSGGFDPLHIGHCRYFNEARSLGSHLIVIVNKDSFLKTKKGFIFMPQEERLEIISNLFSVNDVVLSRDDDMTVCKTLEYLRNFYPDDKLIFAKGGDRTIDNIPEKDICEKLGIEMKFGIGGFKIQSSSHLIRRFKDNESHS